MSAWDRLNTTFKLALGAAVLILAVVGVRHVIRQRDLAPIGPSSSGAATEDYVPVTEGKPIPEGKIKPLPPRKRPEDYSGRVTIIVQDTLRPPTGPPVVVPHKIEVLIPRKDSEPPLIKGTPPGSVTWVYSPIRQPWLRWAPGVILGASVGQSGVGSPHAGVVLLRGWRHVDVGAGVCREGVGPLVAYEFWREFAVIGQWSAFRFGGSSGPASIGVGYRF